METSTRNESPDSLLGEKSQNKSSRSTSNTITTETSTKANPPSTPKQYKTPATEISLKKKDHSTQTNPSSNTPATETVNYNKVKTIGSVRKMVE